MKLNKLFLIVALALIPMASFAKCSGDDIITDFWGKRHGCACNGGNVDERNSKGHRVLSKTPGRQYYCHTSWNDRWYDQEGGWCPDNPTDTQLAGNNNVEIVINEERRCWQKTCPENTYFAGTVTYSGNTKSTSIDYSKCAPCQAGYSLSEGVCWNVPCGTGSSDPNLLTKDLKFGTEAVIYDGVCMPVCDLQAVGEVYNQKDSTYIGIQIKSKNAAALEDLKTMTPLNNKNPRTARFFV